MGSFYEFYKKMENEKLMEIAATPVVPSQPPNQTTGQGVSPPANDQGIQKILKIWPQVRSSIPQVQDPNLKKTLLQLDANPALRGQIPQQQAAIKPQQVVPQMQAQMQQTLQTPK